MKYINFVLISFIIILTSSCGKQAPDSSPVAQAGGVDGGGGKGVLCGNQVQSLDLFEARKLGLYPILKSDNLEINLKHYGFEVAKHFSDSLDAIKNPEVPNLILKMLNDTIIKKFSDISSNEKLNITQDATIKNIPSHCEVVQVAIYDDQNDIIYRDLYYWKQMPVIDQASLIIHELIYKRARAYGITHSDETRKVVGQLFSDNNPEPIFEPIWDMKNKIQCIAGNQSASEETFEFFIKDEVINNQKGLSLYFRTFKGVAVTSRVSAFTPFLSSEQFMNKEFIKMMTTASQKSLNKEWEIEFKINADTGYVQMRALAEDQDSRLNYSNVFCNVK